MIHVDRISKIQEIRALHALSELGYKISVNPRVFYKLILLKYFFNFKMSIRINTNGIFQSIISIDHSVPKTTLCGESRTLIFPVIIYEKLRLKWPDKRSVSIVFTGIGTTGRRKTIGNYLRLGFYQEMDSFGDRRNSFTITKRIDNLSGPGRIKVRFSNKGRTFPIKSWDNKYYKEMLDAHFVLCPSGDFIWTYRFFESIMCGAIPIIQEECELYRGYNYYLMSDDIGSLIYVEEWANSNFELCKSQFTLSSESAERIREELKSIGI